MGYIVNKNGDKIKVKNPDGYCGENVVLVSDRTYLDKKWLIEIYKKDINSNNSDSEFVAEVVLDDEPTDEKIIYHMVKNEVNRYSGYAIVKEIRVMDFLEDMDGEY